jgi:hypothetical protein
MAWRVLGLALMTWAAMAGPAAAQRVWGLASGDVLILIAGDAEEADADGPHSVRRPLQQTVSPITGLPAPPAPPPVVDLIGEQSPGAPTWWDKRQANFHDDVRAVCFDFQNMYSGRNLCCLAAVVAVAAPLANTSADQDIRDWYQREVVGNRDYRDRGNTVNDFFDVAGEWQVLVPVLIGSWTLGSIWDDRPAFTTAGQWGERSLRALLVGSVASGTLQFGLGAGRPGEGSRWRPFHDSNSVAGHGFVGAVPFLTAASMTRSRPLRWTLFAASFGTTWTRLDRDAHYFSQCLLGWSIAYLATRSVNMTEQEMRRVRFTPLELPQGGAGAGVLISY